MSVPSVGGTGTVRKFKNIKQVKNRYNKLINLKGVEVFKCPTKKFFLAYGYKI